MKKLSFITALIMGSAVITTAADDLVSAFKEGKFEGRIRTQYFLTDWGVINGTDKDDNGRGWAVGGSLFYKSSTFYGLSIGAELYTTQNPLSITQENDGINMTSSSKFNSTTSNDLFLREAKSSAYSSGGNPDQLVPYGKGHSVLGQAYLQYDIMNSKIKAGRFLMINPWINPNDTKMIPVTVEGAEIISNDIPNTQIQINYANAIKERGMNHFGNMADTGDTPDAIKTYYTTTYGVATGSNPATFGTAGDAPDVTIVGITNKSIDRFELQVWAMRWPSLIDQGLLEANYGIELGDAIVTLGGRFIQQKDRGAGNLILGATNTTMKYGDNDNRVDTYLWALRTVINYGPAKLLLSASHTDDGADMIAPWRGFLTQGYTRSMTQTDWNANTDAWKVQLDYDFDRYVPGLSAFISYSSYDRDPSKQPYSSMTNRGYQNGNTAQWNLDIAYKCHGNLKGLEFLGRFMDQNNDLDTRTGVTQQIANSWDSSNREMRLEANYRF